MKSTGSFPEKTRKIPEESRIAGSLKNIKSKINRKIRNIALCAAAAVVTVIAGSYLVFNIPIKNVSLADVSVSAHVYTLAEQIDSSAIDALSSDVVTVSSDENDGSEEVMVNIPEIGTIVLTEDTIERCRYATVISISSEYFLRTVEIARVSKDDTIYISAFRTTLLNNRAQDYPQRMNSLELREINRIVFVESDGTETVLWSR